MANVASVIKFFPVAKEGFTTTTSGSVASGAATVPLNSVTGYTNGDVVAFVIEPTSLTNKQAFTGTIDTSGLQVTGVVWTEGTNAAHNTGSTIVDYTTATHMSMVTKGLLRDHNPSGYHKALHDDNAATWIGQTVTASAVNYLNVANAATTGTPVLSAAGSDTAINLNLRGKGLAKTVTIGAGAITIFPYDYVASGCIWSGDAYASTRAASMTLGVVVINGNPVTVAAVAARTFTASKDTYVDVLDNGDGTGLLVYTEVTNNNASPALASNSIRIGIIVTGATTIAAVTSINQGDPQASLPLVASNYLGVSDSLGNLICNRSPQPSLIGFRRLSADFTSTATAETDITGLDALIVNLPLGRTVKLTVLAPWFEDSAVTTNVVLDVREGSTTLASSHSNFAGAGARHERVTEYLCKASTGVHTYKASFNANQAGTRNFRAGTTFKAELV